MSNLDALILGLIQGLTEFLPISSSGHLVLFETLLGLPTEELLVFDISVHMGTLVAIIIYFYSDIKELVFNWRKHKQQWLALIIASLPIVIVGALFGSQISDYFRSPQKVAVMLGLTAVLFWFAENYSRHLKKQDLEKLSVKQMLQVGLLQTVAMIPGVSRSGSTIAGGLIAGLSREAAARFSFLLGLVAIGGAGALTALKLLTSDSTALATSLVNHEQFMIGFVVAAVSGYFAIWGLMRFLKKNSLSWFSVYLLIVSLIGVLLS